MQCDCECKQCEGMNRHVAGACPAEPEYRTVAWGTGERLCTVCLNIAKNANVPFDSIEAIALD